MPDEPRVKANIQALMEDMPDRVVEATRISESRSRETDEVWGGLLDPLIGPAEQTPYRISNFLHG
ncbi:MAG: hypothetical protein JWP48_5702 [Actinoallomurus sp.]|jgi:hypothetical protein|nr:hypothetical protein [Actinoallomurus sp.]